MISQWVLVSLVGYLIGAVPTGVIIVKSTRGILLTEFGSGHTGGTNVKRAAGTTAAVLTAVLDILWGTLSVWVAWLITKNYWMSAVAGSAAVVGHNWSVYIRMKGGIGLSTLYGSLLFFQPLTVTAAILILLTVRQLAVKKLQLHRNRIAIFCMFLLPFILWALASRPEVILLSAIGGLAVIFKTIPDWNRVYETPPA